MNIAVLMTCHNRKEKTLRCLDTLACAARDVRSAEVHVFLVDDGSIDGTSEAVKEFFDHHSTSNTSALILHLIAGSGDLYWAKGMALAWREALKYESAFHSITTPNTYSSFTHFLWLNDDVELYPDSLATLLEDYSSILHQDVASTSDYIPPVLIGSCCDIFGKVSYGATDEKNRLIAPNGHLQESPGWFTGNVVLVSQQVSERIGIIDDTYTHARADFDYAERLKQAGIQFFVASKFVGVCVNDWKDKMRGKSFGARLASLWRPGYSNIHDLWRIRSRYHGILRALISCLHMITLVFRRVK